MTLFQLTLLTGFVIFSCSANKENTTLLLVQTLSRHGDRAPDFLYLTDPNKAEYWPNGLGELTQLGKKQQYDVGIYLRNFYKGFITPDPKEILVFSASERRCLNSVEAFLASFYSPDEQWKFTDDLKWQPISIFYTRSKEDIYLNHRSRCPLFKDIYYRELNSERFQEFYKKHQTMVEVATNHSGLDISNPDNAYKLFKVLSAERIHNRTIPEWAQTHWDEISFLHNRVSHATDKSPVATRLRFGTFLQSISQNLRKKLEGRTPNLKFIIHSSHGVNLLGVLCALNFTSMPLPPFSSTLMFELHEMPDTSKAVRILFVNSSYPLVEMEKPHVLVLDKCSEFCPVEQFMRSYEWMIPGNLTEECQIHTSETYEASGSRLQTRHSFEKYLFLFTYILYMYLSFS